MRIVSGYLLLLFLLALTSTSANAQNKAILGDLDGDQISDLTIVRNTNLHKHWFTRFSNGSYSEPTIFGKPSDRALAADFTGDGIAKPTIIRQSSSGDLEWQTLDKANQTISATWGQAGDELKIGFFDTDSKMDKVAIRLESNRLLKWFVKRSTDSLVEIFNWGIEGDRTFIGNFDDDKINDASVLREVGGRLIWYVRSSKTGAQDGIVFGIKGDKPIQPADIDGNGIDDFIVVRNTSEYSTIYVRYNNQDGTAAKIDSFSFGLVGDNFVVGNYNSATLKTILVSRIVEGKILSSNYIFKQNESPLKLDFGLKGDTLITPNGNSFEIGTEYE